MFKAVFTILIPCVLVSQMLMAAPHGHQMEVTGEPSDHGSRPHFHVHGDEHHHHADDKIDHGTAPEPQDVPDHDSSAVYVTATDAVNGGRVVQVNLAVMMLAVVSPLEVVQPLSFSPAEAAPHSCFRTKCPSFIQHCCLMC